MHLKIYLIFIGFLFLSGCASHNAQTEHASEKSRGSLNDRLTKMSEASAKQIPPEAKAVMEKAAAELKQQKIDEKALKVGDKMPNFTLPNSLGKMVSLASMLKQGPVVVAFYRGGWCPYCNEQLQAYQNSLGEIRAAGGQLVAISPDSPKSAQDMVSAKEIEFTVLSDSGNRFAKQCGLVFAVNQEVKRLYLNFGIDLEIYQGRKEWELPVPATYIVNKDRRITYAKVDLDYTKRAEPADIVAALISLR